MPEDEMQETTSAPDEIGKPAVPVVNWDDSEMKSVYANVVNAASTREEVTLFFGSNQTWNPGDAKQFDVKLLERVILNPHAAKRLFVLLGAVLAQYERRFGEIKIEALQAVADSLRDTLSEAKAQKQDNSGGRGGRAKS